jgi:hypothetical protein
MAIDPHETWYVCAEPFVSADPDLPFNGRRNVTRVRGDDPVYVKWPHLFKPIDPSYRSAPAVEEAVAIPGKKRGA